MLLLVRPIHWILTFGVFDSLYCFVDMNDAMNLAEGCIKHCVQESLNRCQSELNLFGKFVNKTLSDRLQVCIAIAMNVLFAHNHAKCFV